MVKDYVVFDLETTGLSPDKDTIIEIGALKVIQGKVADRFSEFINPHQKLTQQISELTGITDDMLAGARNLQVVVGDFVDFCEDYVVVGHRIRNTFFAIDECLKINYIKIQLNIPYTFDDTIKVNLYEQLYINFAEIKQAL